MTDDDDPATKGDIRKLETTLRKEMATKDELHALEERLVHRIDRTVGDAVDRVLKVTEANAQRIAEAQTEAVALRVARAIEESPRPEIRGVAER